ncbi:MAG: hypothetical protein ACKOQ6_10840 [Bacteroidota bacterium]
MHSSERMTYPDSGIILACLFLIGGVSGSFEAIWPYILPGKVAGIDIAFWGMGLSAGSLLIAFGSISYLILRSPLLKNNVHRDYLIVSILVFVCYFMIAERRIFDAPFWDDFNALLEWFIPRKAGKAEPFLSLLEAYWECKPAVPRLISVFLNSIAGEHFLQIQKYFNGLLLISIASLLSNDQDPKN